ncbi:hypothetical protein V5887_000383 [Klebsiella aerogenes]
MKTLISLPGITVFASLFIISSSGYASLINSITLSKAFDNNAVAAKKNFNENTPTIVGTVTSVDTDILGNPFISLQGKDGWSSVLLEVDEADPYLLKVNKRDIIEATCEKTSGVTLGDVIMKNCSVSRLMGTKHSR